ncbi:MAG: SRPBCC family protein [Acidobacteriota bacterium]
MSERPTGSIHQERILPATPAEVYGAFTDAERHAAFTGAPATFEPKVGGTFTAWGDYIEGSNLELVPGEKLVQHWSTAEWPEGAPPSVLELTFEADPGGTKVTLNQTEIPAEQVEAYRQGWIDHYWLPLERYFGAGS